jgi:hypothetical protein
LFDRPKPTAGCSANGIRRIIDSLEHRDAFLQENYILYVTRINLDLKKKRIHLRSLKAYKAVTSFTILFYSLFAVTFGNRTNVRCAVLHFFVFILAAGCLIRKALANLALTFFVGYGTRHVFRLYQLTWLIRQEEFI